MALKRLNRKIVFNLSTLQIGKVPKYINVHISASFLDIEMRLQLLVTVSKGTCRTSTGVCRGPQAQDHILL